MIFKSGRQRALLWSFIASIALSAATGIFCLLLDSWGPLQERILGTTATIAGASILALASTIPWERQSWQPIGPAGCVVAAFALVLTVFAIWAEPDVGKTFMNVVFTAWILAIALPLIGILGLARLRPQYYWARFTTVIVVALFALQLIGSIVLEPEIDWWDRALGILGILSASGAIAVPILHRLSGLADTRGSPETSDQLTVTCPRCGCAQRLPIGQSSCAECGLRFGIEVEA